MLEELMDRFGEPAKAVQNLLAVANLKAMAHKVWLTEVTQKGDEIRFILFERAKVEPGQNRVPGEKQQRTDEICHGGKALFQLQQTEKKWKIQRGYSADSAGDPGGNGSVSSHFFTKFQDSDYGKTMDVRWNHRY